MIGHFVAVLRKSVIQVGHGVDSQDIGYSLTALSDSSVVLVDQLASISDVSCPSVYTQRRVVVTGLLKRRSAALSKWRVVLGKSALIQGVGVLVEAPCQLGRGLLESYLWILAVIVVGLVVLIRA